MARRCHQKSRAILSLFKVIVTAEDVSRTKPDPDAYLLALKKLAVNADEVLVLENAPLGIESARAAGLRVVALTTTNPPKLSRESRES
ncbi:MAG TPA: HAD family hydrolase [Thermoplasmata archaeon]|nr:HAD family hydrolase [Thermoplasmata archaeon]